MAGLMPWPAHTLIALPVDSRHVPLLPLFASPVTTRIDK
jgi:hypothetical protein